MTTGLRWPWFLMGVGVGVLIGMGFGAVTTEMMHYRVPVESVR